MQHSRRCCYTRYRRCLPRAGSGCNQPLSQRCRQLEVLSQRCRQLYDLRLSQPCSTQPVRHLQSTCACRQLHEVLSQPTLARRRTPVLLACNKQVRDWAGGQGLSLQAFHHGTHSWCHPVRACSTRLSPVSLPLPASPQDMGSKAHTVDFIRKRLERELDQVRSDGPTCLAFMCCLRLLVVACVPVAPQEAAGAGAGPGALSCHAVQGVCTALANF